MRPVPKEKKKDKKSSSNYKDFADILERIYLVRCNLFHGQKKVSDRNDELLVRLSYDILSKWFEPIVASL